MTTRPSTAAPILAVLAVGLVTLGAYVGGYFLLRREAQLSPTGVGYIMRFDTHGKAMFFWPIMRVQGLISGYGIFYMTDDGKADGVCQDRFKL
jgi:hypothetical protein